MKSKFSKIMGVGFALVLVASLMLFAIPTQADPYEPLHPPMPNLWDEFQPTAGAQGLWFFDPDITQVGPNARAINGDFYTYVAGAASTGVGATPNNPGDHDIFKSIDDGRTWTVSAVPFYYGGGAVVDMVCSSMSEDVIYLTDGNYVYRSINGGVTFTLVAAEDLETELMGVCGIAVIDFPITSIDVAYDGSGQPMVFIGTKATGKTDALGNPIVGSVYWIADQTFSAMWTDLEVRCFGCCPTALTEWVAVGDGTIGPFTTTLLYAPVYPTSLSVTDGTETFTDADGDGILTGSAGGTGTINYTTGALSVTFNVLVAAPTDILATYKGAARCYDVYAVAGAPGFENISKAYAVVTGPLTQITFTTGTAGVVEVTAGDASATFDYDSDAASVTLLTGTIVNALGVFQSTVAMSDTSGTITLGAGWTISIAFDTTLGGAVNISNIDGTISWRLVSGAATFCGGTFNVYTLGTVCAWTQVSEIKWDCLWSFTIEHASRIMFPSYYGTDPTLFVGVVAVIDTAGLTGPGEGGDVYRVADTFPPSGCIDLNVQGFLSGCVGLAHANICSLDIENDALAAGAWDSYQLQSPTRVYYSADGGWTWAPSLKDPTGTDRCYVLFGGSIHAATNGCDAAWSLDCGANPGQFFNQISLISFDIEQVLDLTHSPGYAVDSSTLFVLTKDELTCSTTTIISLLRWDGTYWERVHSSRMFNALTQMWLVQGTAPGAPDFTPFYDWVEVSPDFNTTSTLYMANTGFYMTRSIDAGCSWAALIYPCYDRPAISAWIVVDEETVLAAGGNPDNGYVWRTLNHGAQPWSLFAVAAFPSGYAANGVDFDLSLPRNAESDLLLGDAYGQVFFSGDLGATWAEICDVAGNTEFLAGNPAASASDANTYVVFDPGYGIEGDPGVSMIYAAAANTVGRCALDLAGALPFKQDWVYISSAAVTCDPFALCVASGIDAAGDTALYVSDAGVALVSEDAELTGTMAVSYNAGVDSCDLTLDGSTFVQVTAPYPCGEALQIVAYNLECTTTTTITGTVVVQGLVTGGTIRITVNEDLDVCNNCGPVGSAYAVISSDLTLTCATATSCPTGVWRTLNPMALMPPVYPVPLVEWEFLNASTAGAVSLIHPEADSFTPAVFPDDLWVTLTAASNVLWALEDDPGDTPTNSIWIWDDPLARPVIQIQPADGTLLATTTSATIEWEALDNATLYEYFIFSYCATCPDNMALFLNSTTALTCNVITGLTPGTTYFWKVRAACNSPQVSKWSALHSFDTALSAVPYLCAPWCGQDDVILTTNFAWDPVAGALSYELQIVAASADGTADWTGATTYTSAENAYASIPGLEYSTVYYWRVRSVNVSIYSAWAVCLFTTADVPAEPVEPLPPVEVITEEITPVWIWVIIAIGGALTIAVVILIVTTRRVP